MAQAPLPPAPGSQICPGTTSEYGSHRGDQIPSSFIKILCNSVAILAQAVLAQATSSALSNIGTLPVRTIQSAMVRSVITFVAIASMLGQATALKTNKTDPKTDLVRQRIL